MIKVIGIKITDRIKEAGLTQRVLSHHSSVITTRLGFHEVTDEICSREAFIILHLKGNISDADRLIADLQKIGGIEIREMVFNREKEQLNEVSEISQIEIMGIMVERNQDVINPVQKILTAYGCNIRTRLGVNENFFGEPAGLIILELKGEGRQRVLLERDLKELKHVHVRTLVF